MGNNSVTKRISLKRRISKIRDLKHGNYLRIGEFALGATPMTDTEDQVVFDGHHFAVGVRETRFRTPAARRTATAVPPGYLGLHHSLLSAHIDL